MPHHFIRSRVAPLFVLLSAFLLAACGNSGTDSDSNGTARQNPASIMPADEDLKTTYLQSCYACHSRSMSGAPLTGDAEAWAPRMAKGMDVMVKNAMQGFRAMPPLGGCMDCDAKDFEALIEFMAAAPASDEQETTPATDDPAETTSTPDMPDEQEPASDDAAPAFPADPQEPGYRQPQ